MSANWYIESGSFRAGLGDDVVRVIDGGARGGAVAPFDELSAPVEVTGFEPDADADGDSVPKALWKSSGPLRIHLAAGRSASSVYPPNLELLSRFPDRIGVEGRRTERVAEVEAISIDEAVEQGLCAAPDLISLDVHSAEYEVLEGAQQALAGAAVVLVESWHSPVHAGQHLHGDVERLLNESGFHLVDICPAAAWRHTLDGEVSAGDRPRLIASEALFLKDFGAAPAPSARDALVAIALFDLYGYTNYAVELSRRFASSGLLGDEEQRSLEEELLAMREGRGAEASAALGGGVDDGGSSGLRRWAGGVLAALRGRRTAAPAPDRSEPHPLETGTQRLTTGPWK